MTIRTTPTVEIDGNEAFFVVPENHERTTDALFGLLDEADAGNLSPDDLYGRFKRLARDTPDHIDVHAHRGALLLDNGRTNEAHDAYTRAFETGLALLPDGFNGTIEWSYHKNRPFLRAAHGLAATRLARGERAQAIALMEKMLTWNPNDNQGIRFLIGSQYLRARKRAAAKKILSRHAHEYPPYRYELALLHIQKTNWIPGATSLRLGFVENPYVAEVLCGTSDPMPLSISHRCNYCEAGIAVDYDKQLGDLWKTTPDALPFLRWLHTHPDVMVERAAVLACHQALLWEDDISARRSIIDREEQAMGRIDDTSSAKLVACRTAQGKPTRPWAHPRACP